MATIRLKLLVDTKQKKVVFAEAGKDFVDFLCTLLCAPAGTITRLLSKDNIVGSLGKLYEKVENTYLQPNLTKDILLRSKQLGIAIPNDLAEWPECSTLMKKLQKMIYVAPPPTTPAASTPNNHIGFVKGDVTYMIMDDLEMKPMPTNSSTIDLVTTLNHLNVYSLADLEEMVVDLGKDEGVKLLKESLQSQSVLTDVFLGGAARSKRPKK